MNISLNPVPKVKEVITKKCPICSTKFSTNKLRNKIHCSKQCLSKSMSDKPRKNFIRSSSTKGEKNGQYKHGKYAGKDRSGGSSSKKKVRENVRLLDGDWCLFCGKPGPGLHLHRVLYGSEVGKYEVDNCVQLCGIDHDLVHSNKNKWQPFLVQYLQARTIHESKDWVQIQHVRLRASAPLVSFNQFQSNLGKREVG